MCDRLVISIHRDLASEFTVSFDGSLMLMLMLMFSI